MHWYMDQVLELATRIVPVRSILLDAFSMLIPPTALFRPSVLFRVLLHVLRPAPPRMRRPAAKQTQPVLYQAEARE